ncbi:MAG: translocation/assembly module TamB domain-containing protein [Saprospiraceae bacterium]|uniref:Translocation/assembly module TamB domain-containing protein n=1 Tax=Candidatus Opimibacter skivensis TaxID=2982028 RepID=A0A9D7T073_9BACT|nr:translocation/assembly module TamB domain-containing protein [Candidatus Opimibacter skivensis]
MSHYVRKFLKIILWLVGIIVLLVGLAFLLIQVPFIQNLAKNKAVSFLQDKLGTPVTIDHFSLDFPKRITLEGVYFEDQKGDTLLAGDTIRIDISLWKLLSHEVMINEIDLRGIAAYVDKTLPDSAYNFDYILKAFVSQDTSVVTDSTSGMRISVRKINLDRINVKYNDEAKGNNVTIYLRHFDTDITEFDLKNQKYTIPKINLSGLNATLKQTKAISEKAMTTDTFTVAQPYNYPDVSVEEINISDIHIDYDNTITAIDSKIELGSLRVEFDKLDLPNQDVKLKLVHLQNSNASFALGKSAQKAVGATATEVKTAMKNGWIVELTKLNLDSIDFKFDDLTHQQLSKGIDYNYLDLKNLHAEASAISYNADSISGKINQLSVKEHSGLDLKNAQADFYYDQHNVRLDNLVLETPKTFISDQIHLTYPSIDTIAKAPGVLGINAHFIDSKIAVSDLLLFAPFLSAQDPFRKNQNAVIHINGGVDGKVSDLTFSALDISGLGDLRVKASGNITGLPDVNKLYFDLMIDHFYSRAHDITDFIPAGTIPSNIRIPDFIEAKGKFKGSMKSFSTDMGFNSSYGAAMINATVKNITSKGNESYNANIKTTQFDIGRLIKQEDKIGKVTLSASINGIGTDPKTANATFEGKIVEAKYNNYNYHNIALKGSAKNGDIEIAGNIMDPNITLDLHALVNMNGRYPKVDLTLNADSLNLQKLNFYSKDLRFHGLLIADLETADPDYLNGTIELSKATISLSGTTYKVDTLSIVSVATAGEDTLDIRSAFLTANMHGQYKLTQLVSALQSTISKYYNTQPDTVITFDPQKIEFTAKLVRSPFIEALLPELVEMEDANLSGNFDSETGMIEVDGSIPRLKYRDYTIDNFLLTLNTDNNSLNYAVALDQVSSTQLQLTNLSLSGKAQNDILSINLKEQDVEKKDLYRISGEFTSVNHVFKFSLLPDGLLLNKQSWAVAQDNVIQFGGEGIMVRNFNISNDGQSLTINSIPQQVNAPLNIQFNDFKIETFTRLVTKDSLLAGGIINGKASLRELNTNRVFTSDLTIQDFSFHGDTVGNISMKVNNEKQDTYAAEVTISGRGNDVKMDGYYYNAGAQSHFDLNAHLVQLSLKSIEGFTLGELHDASGNITGDLAIKGTMAAPEIRGDLRFQQAGFKLTRFNSYYRAQDEHIRFTPDGIELINFTLLDSTGNKAVFDGNVYTKDFRDYRFGLIVHAENFQVLNSTREDNKLYFGRLFIDTKVLIKGDINHPVVDGRIRVNDKTQLTIVIPQDDPGIVDREGIVQFVDMDTFQLNTSISVQDSLTHTQMTGMDVTVAISVDKNAVLNLIIDEANGDFLKVKGAANLDGGIDPSGKVTLTGIYELEEGTYNFSFNQLRREFQIRRGSTISWTGDPYTADVDVTAVYKANTAPLSLVQNQIGDADQNVINTYKQKLPFEIMLYMKGKLLKPDVTFDIQLPDKNNGVSGEVTSTVQTKLTQLRTEPSELNKQVFAVLLLNRFISEDPFQNAARGGGISSLARQSASKILSEQLNNLVGGMVAGVDLSFDINSIEDYTTGELKNRTDLTVGLTKQLLNDRLKVSIGSNFELEGLQEANRKTTNIAGDVSAEYQLSKDGKYVLRVYRRDEYIIVQGQVIETGIGFVFTADYDKFKDLFSKKTEEQKQVKKEILDEKKQSRSE